MTRTLALCADDFGQSPGIGTGVARLAQAGRLSAISCIVNVRGWPEEAKRLRDLPDSVDIGLHLNFTEGRPLSRRLGKHWRRFPSLKRLIMQAHLGLLPKALLIGEMHSQLRMFIQAHGRPPDFIDGHQHVHHLPTLRPLILDMVEHMQPLPAMRSTGRVIGPGFGAKRWLIERTGGRQLTRELRARAIAHNPALLGAYDFLAPDYRVLMQAWLSALPPEGGLLFCHPADPDLNAAPDAIAAARVKELAYLESSAFRDDLRDEDVQLGRVWRTVDPGALTRRKSTLG
jgi:predicted glycoside hydrolase/deacetylase ChbG (UPF0249 family)